MAEFRNTPRQSDSRDVERVTEEVVGRLSRSGIDVSDADSPEELVQLLDAVEAFERAVQRRGGDLMVDEPPVDEVGQPDDPHFLLPTRLADESIGRYIHRLEAATAEIRRTHPDR
jgi:hypothetical protein